MAAFIVVVVALLYVPMGVLPILPRDTMEAEDGRETGF